MTRYSFVLVVVSVGMMCPRLSLAVDIRGTVEAVTVYRGQALVSRLVDVPGPAGIQEIVITDLPERVLPASIYAESTNGLDVRSVSYRQLAVDSDVRVEVQQLDAQILELQDKSAAARRRQALLEEQKQYLTKLEDFTAATGNVEMSRGVLNSDTLTAMTQFQFDQRSRIAEDGLRLEVELRTLAGQLQMLTRQRQQIATSSSRLAREAVVLVNLTANNGALRLRYLVDQAMWLPSYNIRSAPTRDRVTIEYLASIEQMSGEDWANVQMTLSTATPSLVAKAPILDEMPVTLTRPGDPDFVDVLAQIEQVGTDQARQALGSQRQAVGNVRGSVSNQLVETRNNFVNISGIQINVDYDGDRNELDLVLNKLAGDVQLVDLIAREQISRPKDHKPAIGQEEGLAITYQIANRTSLPSRSDRQLVQIASLPMKAVYYKVASPLLTGSVFDEATVTNDSSTVLLAGNVATYVNNDYVGRGVIPLVAVGQTFNVGLGIDSSLRSRRELLEKNESMQGGNRVVQFSYRISVENFGSQAASVRVLDRLPTANENDVRVSLLSTGRELSQDPLYAQVDRRKGILRWDAEVPSSAVDTKAATLEYQFRLEYDKQLALSSLIPRPATVVFMGAGGIGGNAGGQGGGFGGSGGRGRGGLGLGGGLNGSGRGRGN